MTVCGTNVHAVTAFVVADLPFGAPRSCRLDGADTRLVTVS
jgi:hypothetical protein